MSLVPSMVLSLAAMACGSGPPSVACDRAALGQGQALIRAGRYDQAAVLLEHALLALRGGGVPELAAELHGALARAQRRRGALFEALRHERQRLALLSQFSPEADLSDSHLGLAVIFEMLELPEEAEAHFHHALRSARSARSRLPAMLSFSGFLNDFGAARADEALALAADVAAHPEASPRDLALADFHRGRALMALGRLEEAEAAFARAAGGEEGEAFTAHLAMRRGELAMRRGELDRAIALLGEAEAAYLAQGNRHRLIKLYGILERVHLLRGEESAALRAGRRHLEARLELLGPRASRRYAEALGDLSALEAELAAERLTRRMSLAELNAALERSRARWLAGSTLLLAAVLVLLALRQRRLFVLNRALGEERRALASTNRQLEAQKRVLHAQASTDVLTGVGSRRQGMARLEHLLAAPLRGDEGLAVFLLDLDHFKALNDRHGHHVGDLALRHTAAQLAAEVGVEAVARWGGEEFLITVSGLDAARARALGERLCRALCERPFTTDGEVISLSASIGLVVIADGRWPPPDEVLRAADRALYAAKAAGRGRLHCEAA